MAEFLVSTISNGTRLHSSRMCTARLLTISPSMYCTGGSAPRGVSAPGGVSAPRVSAPGGGCLLLGGVCSGGVVCSQGGSSPGGVSAPKGGIPACTEA